MHCSLTVDRSQILVLPSLLILRLFSLAIGHDITEGSTNKTFYSSSGSGFGPFHVLRYSGSQWEIIDTDSVIYHNAGANGRFIYFQHGANNGEPNDQTIARLMPDGSLLTIFNDTTLRFTVADISVDSIGNIYCFRGPSIGNTTELTVIDSTGQIIGSFDTDLDGLSTLYGSAILNGTHYLGHGTTNGQFFPLEFAGSTVSMGPSITYGGAVTFKDLASCHQPSVVHTAIELDVTDRPNVQILVDHDRIIISGLSPMLHDVSLIDLHGRVLLSRSLQAPEGSISVPHVAAGIYHVVVQSGSIRKVQRLILGSN